MRLVPQDETPSGPEKQETLKKRKEACEAIKKLKAEAELTVPKLRKEFDREGETVKAAGKKLEAAKMKHGRKTASSTSRERHLPGGSWRWKSLIRQLFRFEGDGRRSELDLSRKAWIY